jgi:hypothetical protein
MPDEVIGGMQLWRPTFTKAIEEGVLTVDEVRQFERDIDGALDRGDAFVAVTMYGVLARKDEAAA